MRFPNLISLIYLYFPLIIVLFCPVWLNLRSQRYSPTFSSKNLLHSSYWGVMIHVQFSLCVAWHWGHSLLLWVSDWPTALHWRGIASPRAPWGCLVCNGWKHALVCFHSPCRFRSLASVLAPWTAVAVWVLVSGIDVLLLYDCFLRFSWLCCISKPPLEAVCQFPERFLLGYWLALCRFCSSVWRESMLLQLQNLPVHDLGVSPLFQGLI